jgi:hypothetical protein
MKKVTAAMLLTAALSAGATAFAQTGTNPTGQVDNPTAQTQNQKPAELKDIPAGHWASEAIKVAANCGIVRGFPDGTFRGNEPVTRYQAAAIVARLLDAVRNGECGIPKYVTSADLNAAVTTINNRISQIPNAPAVTTPTNILTPADLAVLQNAIQELAADLAQLGVRVAELEDNAVTADDLARVEEIATQARDLAEAAAAAAQEANDTAVAANDAAAGAQEAADSAAAAAEAAQQTADDALAAAAASQQAADDAAAGVAGAQQTADDAINAAANAQQAADDAMAVAMAAQEAADAAAAAAETAQQTADDALAAAAAAQQTADDAAAAAGVAQQTADDALAAAASAQQTADDAVEAALAASDAAAAAQQAADDALAAAAAAQQTADDALAAAEAAGAEGAAAAQQTADDALAAAQAAQDASDDAIAVALAAQESADAAAAAAGVAQQTADDALALAQAAQPAGDYASTDDLAGVAETAQQARDLAEAAAAAIENLSLVSPEAIQDLTDQVEATSIAADTALAQARELQDRYDELNGRIDDLGAQLGELGAVVEGQADSIAALNDLVVLLNQDVLSLQDRVTQLERGLANANTAIEDVAANAASQEDLESLREFTTLLRRDQTALADRVGELEARVGRVEGRVTAVEGRVAALEANTFTVGGTITLRYNVARVWDPNAGNAAAPDFDIDRLGMTGVMFASGNVGTSDFGSARGVSTTGQVLPVVGSAPTVRSEGFVDADFAISFTFRPRNLLESSKEFRSYPNFTIKLEATNTADYNANGKTFDPITFKLGSVDARFEVGNQPLLVTFGIAPAFAFNTYAFNNTGGRGDGFVATLSGAGLLPFSPTLTIAYGSKNGAITSKTAAVSAYTSGGGVVGGTITRLIVGTGGATRVELSQAAVDTLGGYAGTTSSTTYEIKVSFSDADTQTVTWKPADGVAISVTGAGTVTGITFARINSVSSGNGDNGDNRYFTAFRGTARILDGFTGGVYYGYEGLDVIGAPNITTVYGLDFTGKLFGLLDVTGEYNISQVNSSAAGVAAFVNVGATLAPFTVAANIRSIDSWYAGLSNTDASRAYSAGNNGQTGFGVSLDAKQLFGFVDFGVYFDSRTSRLAGLQVAGGPKAGFAADFKGTATGADGETLFGLRLGFRLIGFDFGISYDVGNETFGGLTTGPNTRDDRRFQVRADHDGSKAGALLGGVNLSLGYRVDINNTSATVNPQNTIWAYADTKLNLAGFSVAPTVYFSSVDRSGAGDDITNLGVRLTANGDFLFGSKLNLGFGYDSSSHSAPVFSASTVWALVGANWAVGPFGAPSTFGLQFAYRQDTNRNGTGTGPTFASPIGNGSWGSDINTNTNTLYGLYGNFGYFGLNFGYGIFNLTNTTFTGGVWGQRFQISYALKF